MMRVPFGKTAHEISTSPSGNSPSYSASGKSLFQRASAPARAISALRSGDSASSRAFPPLRPASYVERSNLSIRMGIKRFARLGNGFSKKLDQHCAAIALYVAHYNLCRVHESLRQTPAMALGVTDHVWTIAELIEAALGTQPITPETTAPQRRKTFRVIEGGKP
jgi:hypothetical protein